MLRRSSPPTTGSLVLRMQHAPAGSSVEVYVGSKAHPCEVKAAKQTPMPTKTCGKLLFQRNGPVAPGEAKSKICQMTGQICIPANDAITCGKTHYLRSGEATFSPGLVALLALALARITFDFLLPARRTSNR